MLRKWRTNFWFILCGNAAAHRSILVKDFWAKNYVTILQHPPDSPGLPAADFYLFPRPKSALKGRRYCGAGDIIKNASEELKRLSQNSLQECFQHLYSRWKKRIFAQGDYFEGKVAVMTVLFCISQKDSDPENILNLPRRTSQHLGSSCLSDSFPPLFVKRSASYSRASPFRYEISFSFWIIYEFSIMKNTARLVISYINLWLSALKAW